VKKQSRWPKIKYLKAPKNDFSEEKKKILSKISALFCCNEKHALQIYTILENVGAIERLGVEAKR
jgi:hypothetical protein